MAAIGVLVASIVLGVTLIGNGQSVTATTSHSTTQSTEASSSFPPNSSTTTTLISTSSTSSGNCASSSKPIDNNSGTWASVYNVRSSIAFLCVTYQFEGAGLANFTITVQPWYQNGSQLGSSQSETNYTLPTITASPSFSNHSASAMVNVTYTIQSPANLTGLFIVFHDGCDPFYLAFGTVPASVFLTAWTCGPNNVLTGGYRSGNYSVTGFTNIEAYSVPWA